METNFDFLGPVNYSFDTSKLGNKARLKVAISKEDVQEKINHFFIDDGSELVEPSSTQSVQPDKPVTGLRYSLIKASSVVIATIMGLVSLSAAFLPVLLYQGEDVATLVIATTFFFVFALVGSYFTFILIEDRLPEDRSRTVFNIIGSLFLLALVLSGVRISFLGITQIASWAVLVGIALVLSGSVGYLIIFSLKPDASYQTRLLETLFDKYDKSEDRSVVETYIEKDGDDLIWKKISPNWQLVSFFNQFTLIDVIITLFVIIMLLLSASFVGYLSFNSLNVLLYLGLPYIMTFVLSIARDGSIKLFHLSGYYMRKIWFLVVLYWIQNTALLIGNPPNGLLNFLFTVLLLYLIVPFIILIFTALLFAMLNPILYYLQQFFRSFTHYMKAKSTIVHELQEHITNLDIEFDHGKRDNSQSIDKYFYSRNLIKQSIETIQKQPFIAMKNLKRTLLILSFIIPIVSALSSVVAYINTNQELVDALIDQILQYLPI